MNKKFLFSIMAVFALTLLPASNVLAGSIVLDLNNDTAPLCTTGCPADDASYWHFVITPNNGDSYFVTFHLNLGDGFFLDTDVFIPNGSQTDNVFVSVPLGKTVYSLIAEGSTATVVWNGTGNAPSKFVLSSICTPVPEAGSTLLLLGMSLVPIAFSYRRRPK
jgi:hypothetical protein